MPEPKPTPGPAEKLCPECGQDVSDIDIEAHARQHWGEKAPDPRKFKEASRRYKALMRLKGGA